MCAGALVSDCLCVRLAVGECVLGTRACACASLCWSVLVRACVAAVRARRVCLWRVRVCGLACALSSACAGLVCVRLVLVCSSCACVRPGCASFQVSALCARLVYSVPACMCGASRASQDCRVLPGFCLSPKCLPGLISYVSSSCVLVSATREICEKRTIAAYVSNKFRCDKFICEILPREDKMENNERDKHSTEIYSGFENRNLRPSSDHPWYEIIRACACIVFWFGQRA